MLENDWLLGKIVELTSVLSTIICHGEKDFKQYRFCAPFFLHAAQFKGKLPVIIQPKFKKDTSPL